MAIRGQILDNPVTGERIVFRATAADTGGEVLAFDLILAPGGHVPAPHVHPEQEERFEVKKGRMQFWLGLKRVIAGPGQIVVVPPGAVHFFANAGKETAQVRVEVRPALRMEQLLEVSTALAQEGRTVLGGIPKPLDMALFLREFERETRIPFIPPQAVQALTAPLAALARFHGLDRRYRGPYRARPRRVRRLSVDELFGPRFVLLAGAGGQPWIEAAERVGKRLQLDLSAHRLPSGSDLAEKHGLGSTGAVLVRPDGVVGWQAETLSHDPERTLAEAVLRLGERQAA